MREISQRLALDGAVVHMGVEQRLVRTQRFDSYSCTRYVYRYTTPGIIWNPTQLYLYNPVISPILFNSDFSHTV